MEWDIFTSTEINWRIVLGFVIFIVGILTAALMDCNDNKGKKNENIWFNKG